MGNTKAAPRAVHRKNTARHLPSKNRVAFVFLSYKLSPQNARGGGVKIENALVYTRASNNCYGVEHHFVAE
jgi:hypothetical protein